MARNFAAMAKRNKIKVSDEDMKKYEKETQRRKKMKKGVHPFCKITEFGPVEDKDGNIRTLSSDDTFQMYKMVWENQDGASSDEIFFMPTVKLGVGVEKATWAMKNILHMVQTVCGVDIPLEIFKDYVLPILREEPESFVGAVANLTVDHQVGKNKYRASYDEEEKCYVFEKACPPHKGDPENDVPAKDKWSWDEVEDVSFPEMDLEKMQVALKQIDPQGRLVFLSIVEKNMTDHPEPPQVMEELFEYLHGPEADGAEDESPDVEDAPSEEEEQALIDKELEQVPEETREEVEEKTKPKIATKRTGKVKFR